jgi:hypothetical protein
MMLPALKCEDHPRGHSDREEEKIREELLQRNFRGDWKLMF